MQKDFDVWNERKKQLNESSGLFYRPREIWVCSVGLNIGAEIDGKGRDFARPVLIYKEINKEMLWCIPLTTQIREDRSYFKFNLGGLDNAANLTQMRPISAKRLSRKVAVMPVAIFLEMKRLLLDALA